MKRGGEGEKERGRGEKENVLERCGGERGNRQERERIEKREYLVVLLPTNPVQELFEFRNVFNRHRIQRFSSIFTA